MAIEITAFKEMIADRKITVISTNTTAATYLQVISGTLAILKIRERGMQDWQGGAPNNRKPTKPPPTQLPTHAIVCQNEP